MPARCYAEGCRNHNIEEEASRVKFFLAAVLLVAAVYGAIDLGAALTDLLGR